MIMINWMNLTSAYIVTAILNVGDVAATTEVVRQHEVPLNL